MKLYRVTWQEDCPRVEWYGNQEDADAHADYLRNGGTAGVEVKVVTLPRDADKMASWVNLVVRVAALNERKRF